MKIKKIILNSARLAPNDPHRRYLCSQLDSGFLTAHESIHLVLLHSCPDTVHEVPLRKTQASTSLTEGSSTEHHPRRAITPAVADCRYRAPLSPRLRGNFLTKLIKYSGILWNFHNHTSYAGTHVKRIRALVYFILEGLSRS